MSSVISKGSTYLMCLFAGKQLYGMRSSFDYTQLYKIMVNNTTDEGKISFKIFFRLVLFANQWRHHTSAVIAPYYMPKAECKQILKITFRPICTVGWLHHLRFRSKQHSIYWKIILGQKNKNVCPACCPLRILWHVTVRGCTSEKYTCKILVHAGCVYNH